MADYITLGLYLSFFFTSLHAFQAFNFPHALQLTLSESLTVIPLDQFPETQLLPPSPENEYYSEFSAEETNYPDNSDGQLYNSGYFEDIHAAETNELDKALMAEENRNARSTIEQAKDVDVLRPKQKHQILTVNNTQRGIQRRDAPNLGRETGTGLLKNMKYMVGLRG